MNQPTAMPPGLVAYRRTPVFREDTIPAGLLREHRTKPGVWALIKVLEGGLRFRVPSGNSEPSTLRRLSAGEGMVVAPEEPHEVEPDGPVRFFVEFYRATEPDAENKPVLPEKAPPG